MANEEKIVPFVCSGKEYAIGYAEAAEILRKGEIRTVPQVPQYVAGVINLRGKIIPVMDLELLLGEKCAAKHEKVFVVKPDDSTLVGLLADSVGAITGIVRESNQKSGKIAGMDFGTSVVDKRRIALLDLKKLFNGVL